MRRAIVLLLAATCVSATAGFIDNPSTGGGGGSGSGLSNASLNGNLGSVTGTVTYLNVDIPDYDPASGGLNVGSVAGVQSTLDYATATLASGVTDSWHVISVSSNGLVVAAWTRDTASAKGYVYIGTNGPNSLAKNNTLGLQTTADIKVTPDGSKTFVAHYDDPWYNGAFVKVTTNNGSSWTTLRSGASTFGD
jgi:hypothetical protein